MCGAKTPQPAAFTTEEVQLLQQLICAPGTSPPLVRRARIVLAAHAHPEQSDRQTAAMLGTTETTVRTWRRRWVKIRSLKTLSCRRASRFSIVS